MNPKIKDVAGGNRSRMGGVVSFLVQEKNEIIIYLFGNNLVASFANGIDAKLVIIRQLLVDHLVFLFAAIRVHMKMGCFKMLSQNNGLHKYVPRASLVLDNKNIAH